MEQDIVKKKVFSGLFWKLGERVSAQVISFLVTVILARLLMPQEYGLISIVLVFNTISNVFVVSGFGTSLIQKKDATDEDFSTMFYCSFTVSLVIYAILFFAAPTIANFYAEPSLCMILRVFSLQIPITAYTSIQNAYVARHMIFKKTFLPTLLGTLVSGVIGIVMAYYGYGVWALVAQYVFNTVVSVLVMHITVPWRLKPQFSWKSVKKLMNYGWKVLVADLSNTFFDQIRGLLIGKAYTPADLAFYNKGQQLPNMITANISDSVMNVMFPAISDVNGNMESVKLMVRRCVKLLSYIIMPMMLGMAAVARPLVIVLFTEKWSETAFYVQILSFSAVIGLIGTISLQTLKAIGRSDVQLRLEFYQKPVYLIFLVVGMTFSVRAVGMAMVLYTLYATLLNMLQFRKYVNYSMREQIKDILPELTLSGVMYLLISLLLLLPFGNFTILCLQVLTGIVIYVGGSILFRLSSFLYVKDLLLGVFKKK